MKKATSSESKRITPFHDGPFSVFKHVFYNADHFCLIETINKHFSDGFASLNGLFCHLVVDGIVTI